MLASPFQGVSLRSVSLSLVHTLPEPSAAIKAASCSTSLKGGSHPTRAFGSTSLREVGRYAQRGSAPTPSLAFGSTSLKGGGSASLRYLTLPRLRLDLPTLGGISLIDASLRSAI